MPTSKNTCVAPGCDAPLGRRTQVPFADAADAATGESDEEIWTVYVWCTADEHHRMREAPDGSLHLV